MKKINTLLIFILLFTSILCFADTVNDSMKMDESSTDENHVTDNRNKVLDWLKDNLAIVIPSITTLIAASSPYMSILKLIALECKTKGSRYDPVPRLI